MSPESQVNLAHIPNRYALSTGGEYSLSYYPYAWLGQFLTHQDILSQLFTLRILSVLMACGTAIFAFLSARKIFPKSLIIQILIPWLIIFNPSFMVIGTSINDGNLAVLLSTIIFYLLLLDIAHQRMGWRSAVAFGLTLLAIWTKPTTYFLLLVWGILLLTRIRGFSWKYWLGGGIIGGLFIALLLFLPFRFLNIIVGYQKFQVSVEGIAFILSSRYFWDVFASFWIILGYFVYRLDQGWYVMLLVLWLLAMAGLFIYTRYFFKRNGFILSIEQKSLLFSLLFAGLSLIELLGLAILRYDGQDGRLARYIFPAIVPLSILMVTGWRTLLPINWRNVGFLFLASAFFLFDTMVWLNYAIPWYYPFWPY
jgi:hypothetical protein